MLLAFSGIKYMRPLGPRTPPEYLWEEETEMKEEMSRVVKMLVPSVYPATGVKLRVSYVSG